MQINIRHTKAIMWGALIIVLQMVVFYLLWMNPIVKEISAQVEGHPSIKPYEFIGGLDNWMMIRSLFHIFFLSVCLYLYLLLYKSIPGTGWQKGMYFGLLIGFINHIPQAFNQWTLIVYPSQLIWLQLINGLIGFVIFGILIAVLYGNLKVIEEMGNST